MFKLVWDQIGERYYETGVDRGVLYPQDDKGAYPAGEAWNGLTAVTESPSGAEPSPLYADNIKYAAPRSAEEFGATVEAFTYPDGFKACNGEAELAPGVTIGQQKRQAFGMSYRTLLGNDVKDTEYGYKIHLIYGATANPSEKAYNSVNDSPDISPMSWEITTTPVAVEGFKPTACLTIDSTKVSPEGLAALEEALYGTADKEAYLPLPDEVAQILGGAAA